MSKIYEPIIGLEIHVQLATKSKMFCRCNGNWYGRPPNSNTCPVCLGMPGTLPVPNRKAIEWTTKIGLALNCKINQTSKFDRKHYFYPDLNKSIQISQLDKPIAYEGSVLCAIDTKGKKEQKAFRINRVHLEEDAGKLVHIGKHTLVDANRAGVALVEIVTEPDFRSALEVKQFLDELFTILSYLGVSDLDLEKGSMRLEPNISLRVRGKTHYPEYKVEVKNINSFNFAKKAIEYEITRQTRLLESEKIPIQETRGYNETKGITISQRTKETFADYRYFPEPDIPPFTLSKTFQKKIQSTIPELPSKKYARFTNEYSIKENDAFILTRDSHLAKYYEEVIALTKSSLKRTLEEINKSDINQHIANAIVNKKISINRSPKEFLDTLLKDLQPIQTDSTVLLSTIKTVLDSNQKAVQQYKSGKKTVIMFLVGQVMKEMKGQADAQVVKSEIENALNN